MSDLDDNYGEWMNRIQNKFEEEGLLDDEELVDLVCHSTGDILGMIQSVGETEDPELLEEQLATVETGVVQICVMVEMDQGYR